MGCGGSWGAKDDRLLKALHAARRKRRAAASAALAAAASRECGAAPEAAAVLGDADGDAKGLGVAERDCVAVALRVTVGEPERETPGGKGASVSVREAVAVGVTLGVTVGERETPGGKGASVSVREAVAVGVAEGVLDTVKVSEDDGDGEGEGVEDGDGNGVGAGVPAAEGGAGPPQKAAQLPVPQASTLLATHAPETNGVTTVCASTVQSSELR